MVSANHWLCRIKFYRLSRYLTGVSTNHASSNSALNVINSLCQFDPYFSRFPCQAAKLLDNGRSQTIGIIMSSLNCQLEDIKEAIYKMDTSVIDMDG